MNTEEALEDLGSISKYLHRRGATTIAHNIEVCVNTIINDINEQQAEILENTRKANRKLAKLLRKLK